MFNLREIIQYAYREALSYRNIVTGFNSCGLWIVQGGGVNHKVVTKCEISNREGALNETEAFKNYIDLYQSYVRSGGALASDLEFMEHGNLDRRKC